MRGRAKGRRAIVLQAGVLLATLGLGAALGPPAAARSLAAASPSPAGSSGAAGATPAGTPVALPDTAPPVLVPTAVAGSTAPVPTVKGVSAAVGPLLRDAGLGRAIGVVTDPATGAVLLDTSGGRTATPASTLKVLTAVAALQALGPWSHLTTRVVRSGSTVTIVGAGDHSLTRTPSTLGGAPTASLAGLASAAAAALKKAGVASVQVRYDDSLFTGPTVSPGWGSNLVAVGAVAPVTALSVDEGRVAPGSVSRVADPARSAARAFAAALVARGIRVAGTVARAAAPAGAAEVASARSPAIATLVEHTLTVSDNDMAEALAHLAGGKLGGSASFAGGAAATTKVLASLGVSTAGLKLSDGSGLSRGDQASPTTIAGALAAVATQKVASGAPAGAVQTWPTATGLPVAGFTGTLSERFTASDAKAGRGVVRAKTGTLTGVSGLAGLVRDRDGRLLAFSFMAGGVPAKDRATAAFDRAAAALASCGCR